MSVELFVSLAMSKRREEIECILQESENISCRALGDRENNRAAVEAMADAGGALYELVVNGSDSIIEYFQKTGAFRSDPQTPLEALHEIHDFYADKPESPVSLIVNEVNKRWTINVSDIGTGISAHDMKDTILNIHGSNKLKNKLVAGSYGHGAKAVANFCDVMMVMSSTGDGKINFTVVMRLHPPTYKAPYYVYYTGTDGNVFSVDRAEVEKLVQVHEPHEVNASNIKTEVRDWIICPTRGTTVKLINYERVMDGSKFYYYLREIHFGMPYPLRYVAERVTSPLYNIKGWRYVLDAAKGERVIYKNSISKIMEHPFGDTTAEMGQFKINIWVLDYYVDASGKLKKPKDYISTQPDSPVFITSNGQTHARMRLNSLLSDARLPYLLGHIVVEIDCDLIDVKSRGYIFTSNREQVKRGFEAVIRECLNDFFKSGDPGLMETNNYLRDKTVRSSDKATDENIAQRLSAFLKAKLTGEMFANYGGKPSSNTAPKPESVPIELLNPPTSIGIRKTTLQRGRQEWVVVPCNAVDDYPHEVKLVTPTGVICTSKTKLTNGRASFQLRVSDHIPAGTELEIAASIERPNLPPLRRSKYVHVVEPEVIDRDQASGSKKRPYPRFNVVLVDGQSDQSWVQLHTENAKEQDIAFNYIYNAEQSCIDVYINLKFSTLEVAMEYAARQGSDTTAAEKLMNRYQAKLCAASLACLDQKLSDLEIRDSYRVMAALAQTILLSEQLDHFDN